MMKTIEREESGQTLVYVALSLVTLLLFVALAIEAGHLYAERRRMQNAADAGALAGVRELCLGGAAPTAVAVARTYAVTKNGATWATPVASGQIPVRQCAGERQSLLRGTRRDRPRVDDGGGQRAGPLPEHHERLSHLADYGQEDTVSSAVPSDAEATRPSTLRSTTSIAIRSSMSATTSSPAETPVSQRGWYSSDPNSCNVPFLRGALNGGYPQFPVHRRELRRRRQRREDGRHRRRQRQGDHRLAGVAHGPSGLDSAVQLSRRQRSGADGSCSCQKPGSCQGGYEVGAFACLEIMSWQKSYDVPRKPGNSKQKAIGAIEARIRCDCTTLLRPEGRHPRPRRRTDPGAGAYDSGLFCETVNSWYANGHAHPSFHSP